jgi:hypothetical protein
MYKIMDIMEAIKNITNIIRLIFLGIIILDAFVIFNIGIGIESYKEIDIHKAIKRYNKKKTGKSCCSVTNDTN